MISLSGAGAILKDKNNHVLMIHIRRRGMTRWELPTRILKKGESIFTTLYRCVEEESSSQVAARIGRPVCLALNMSKKKNLNFFGIFFECTSETNAVKLTDYPVVNIPDDLRQSILGFSFLDWHLFKKQEVHPQHLEILQILEKNPGGPFFNIVTDADEELAFYNNPGIKLNQLLMNVKETSENPNDEAGSDPPGPTDIGQQQPVRVFISYSHKDEKYKDDLINHLAGLKRNGIISDWTDRQILGGEKWDEVIKKNLEDSGIIIFLVSSAFMNSDYINEVEIKRAIEKHQKGEAVIVPVIIKYCDFSSLPLNEFQALPKNVRPIEDWSPRNKGWLDVTNQLKVVIKNFKHK